MNSKTPAPPAANTSSNDDENNDNIHDTHTWRFWAILVSLSVTGMLSAVDGTIITSALPTITAALGGGDAYIWVPNAFLLASVAVLPLFAQASNIFGRRGLLLGAVATFMLGSGLAGGASSMTMLIAARTVQGLGGGGINLLMETVLTDIVPLRERGKYMSIVMLGSTLGATLGPFLGGFITAKTTWRWIFYINLPIGGGQFHSRPCSSRPAIANQVAAVFVSLFLFLRVKHQRSKGWTRSLARVDVSGNAIFIAAIVSVLLALTWGGTVYSWSTFHIVVPLILGFVGIFLFTAFEWTPQLVAEPSFPRQVVSNRTSAAALVLTLIHAIVTFWAYYFLPIYFQAVLGYPPLHSGVATLPIFAGSLLFAVLGGVLLSKIGRYKPLHLAGFLPLTLSFGLFSLLDASSSMAAWVCFQLLWAFGSGFLVGILLPAVQAPLDESLVATTTGVWSFARYFGCVWGVTIPSAVFNNECRRLAGRVSNAETAHYLKGGRAYQYATKVFLDSIEDQTLRAEVVQVFAQALRTVWLVGIAVAGLGLVVVFAEKEIKLRDKLNTEFGMDERKRDDDTASPETANIALSTVPSPRDIRPL